MSYLITIQVKDGTLLLASIFFHFFMSANYLLAASGGRLQNLYIGTFMGQIAIYMMTRLFNIVDLRRMTLSQMFKVVIFRRREFLLRLALLLHVIYFAETVVALWGGYDRLLVLLFWFCFNFTMILLLQEKLPDDL
jgi:hypothetical protein